MSRYAPIGAGEAWRRWKAARLGLAKGAPTAESLERLAETLPRMGAAIPPRWRLGRSLGRTFARLGGAASLRELRSPARWADDGMILARLAELEESGAVVRRTRRNRMGGEVREWACVMPWLINPPGAAAEELLEAVERAAMARWNGRGLLEFMGKSFECGRDAEALGRPRRGPETARGGAIGSGEG